MLSIGSLKNASHRYYADLAREDYYTKGGGGPPGRYAGKGAETLGLKGNVSKDAIRNLFEGRSPEGEPLVQLQKRKTHAPGWDATWSAPKSVSIAWALADEPTREKLLEAHQAAVKEAIAYLEAEAAWGRRGKGGHTVERVGLVALLYDHHTSRAQDMALHTHALLMNIGVREDGTTGSIRSLDIYQAKMAAGAIYRTELARQVKLLGYELTKGEHSFELAGVSRKVIDAFSKRSLAIKEALAEEGSSGPKAKELAALSTRQRKGHVERPALFAQWKKHARELGLDQVLPTLSARKDRALDLAPIVAKVSKELADERGAFRERDLVQHVGAELEHTGVGAVKLQAAVRSFISSGKDLEHLPDERFSTKTHLEKERALLEVATRSKAERSHVVREKDLARAEARFPTLLFEQRDALRHIAVEPGGVKLVQGYAGTGKTTLLRAAREAWEARGLTVIGACVAKSAADNLQREAGIKSRTIASLEKLIDRSALDTVKHHGAQLVRPARTRGRPGLLGAPGTWKPEKNPLGPKTVLVIDEASMVSTAHLAKLTQAAREKGAKVVLVGDPAQLGAIKSAGGGFVALAEALGSASLKNIQRQREPWMREASLHFAQGDPATALSLYAKAGKVTVSATRDQAKRDMVEAWFATRSSDPRQTLMLAGTRRDVADLNRLAQEKRRETGELGKVYVTANGERLYAGDRVTLTQNNSHLGLTNGDTAVVERALPSAVGSRSKLSLVIDTPGEKPRRVGFDLRTYDNIALGYATTAHKSQGQTRDRSLVLAGGWMQDKELSYVEMTRHREDCRLFASEADAGEDLAELVRTMKKSRIKETAIDFRDERELHRVRSVPLP